jgi:hypothetical protein
MQRTEGNEGNEVFLFEFNSRSAEQKRRNTGALQDAGATSDKFWLSAARADRPLKADR